MEIKVSGDVHVHVHADDLSEAARAVAAIFLRPAPTTQENTIMTMLADIQAALAADEAAEAKIIGLLSTQAQSLASLSTQLTAAIAANDPVAMQAVVDQMNADATTMEAAAAGVTPGSISNTTTLSAATVAGSGGFTTGSTLGGATASTLPGGASSISGGAAAIAGGVDTVTGASTLTGSGDTLTGGSTLTGGAGNTIVGAIA